MNLLEAFHRCVVEHPHRPALIDPEGRRWTYSQLSQRSQELAARFAQQGLTRGDRVLLALGLDAELYAALAALWRIGAVAVLPEPALGLAGIWRAAELTAPRAVLLAGPYRLLPLLIAPLRQLVQLRLRAGSGPVPAVADLRSDDPALISFTTGSTGLPKAIMRSHGFMLAQNAAVAPLIGTGGQHETDLVGFPVFVIANLGQGITSVLPDWPVRRMDKASGQGIARLIARHGVTRLLLNPALVERLAQIGIPAQVHSVFTGGGPVFGDLIRKIMAGRPGLRLVLAYGSTEAEPIADIDARTITEADYAAMAGGQGLLAGCPLSACALPVTRCKWLAGMSCRAISIRRAMPKPSCATPTERYGTARVTQAVSTSRGGYGCSAGWAAKSAACGHSRWKRRRVAGPASIVPHSPNGADSRRS